jgi:hypothetical protein
MSRDSGCERTQDEWGHDDSHEPQEYLCKNMKMDCNTWSIYAYFCSRQNREERPGRDCAPLDCDESQECESRGSQRQAYRIISGKTCPRRVNR